ncbi:glutamate-rich protein 6B [Spea bombifrons]|uniref:glutamate-rich protein 6B n=1 Tax=Spea bombifrons TaxID=233779 RepID=UPI002349059F|nr:glutamate-rich protein 6B [Spea bombifrons]
MGLCNVCVVSVAKQERVVDKTPHTKYEEELCNSERSCIIEDKLPTTTEGQTMCAFCHEAKKPFPTPEQLSSEPEHTLFCCESYQTLFHYFIMGIIEANTCGEKEDPFDIRPDADFGGGQDVVENLKKDEDTIDIKPHFYFAEEQEAFEDLKKEFSKTNMQNYIISVANHLKVFGSLFAMNTISFTLAAEDNKITDNVKIDIPYSGNAFNCFLDDLFISVPVLPNPLLEKDSVGLFDHSKSIPTPPRDSLLHPLMVKGLHSSFPVEQKLEDPPRGQHTTIQKSVISNLALHRDCSLLTCGIYDRTVLDPLGGSYLEENGMHKKIWTWWDFSQHVHAPPFQSITLRLNPNTEVSLLAQDQIHVTFSSNKKKATFNVGSKLLLKDPGKAILLKKALGSKEASYLRLKKYQIYSLLDHISKSVRISTDLPNRTEIIQDCVSQIIKSITYIRKLASRHQDPLLFQMKFSKGIVGESAGVRDPHIKKKQRERISQQTGGHPAKAASSTQAKSRKDTKEMAKKHGGKQPANKNMQQRTEILKPL